MPATNSSNAVRTPSVTVTEMAAPASVATAIGIVRALDAGIETAGGAGATVSSVSVRVARPLPTVTVSVMGPSLSLVKSTVTIARPFGPSCVDPVTLRVPSEKEYDAVASGMPLIASP
jgi:hypothetical protein